MQLSEQESACFRMITSSTHSIYCTYPHLVAMLEHKTGNLVGIETEVFDGLVEKGLLDDETYRLTDAGEDLAYELEEAEQQ